MHKIMHMSSSPDMWQTTIEQEHTNLQVDPLTQELVDGTIIHQVTEPNVQESQMAEITEEGPDALFIEEDGQNFEESEIVSGDWEDEPPLEEELESAEEEAEMEEDQEDWRGGPDAEDIVPEDGMTEVDEGTYSEPEYMPPPPPYAPTPAISARPRSIAPIAPISSFKPSAGFFASLTPAPKFTPATPSAKIAVSPIITSITQNAKAGNPNALAAIKALSVRAKQGNPLAIKVVQGIHLNATGAVQPKLGGFGGRLGFAGDVIDTTGKVVHTVTRPISWAVETVGDVVEFVGDAVRNIGRKI